MRSEFFDQLLLVDDELPQRRLDVGNFGAQMAVEEWLGRSSRSWSTAWFETILRAVFELLDGRAKETKTLALEAASLSASDMEHAYALRLASECELAMNNITMAVAFINQAFTLCPQDRWIRQTLARVLAASGHDTLAEEVDASLG